MKNIKIILTALVIALCSCNSANTMTKASTTSLITRLQLYIPSWTPSAMPEYSQGIIQRGISFLNETKSAALESYEKLRQAPGLVARMFGTADTTVAEATLQQIRGTVTAGDKSISCMSVLQDNTQAAYDFVVENAKQIQGFSKETLYNNTNGQSLAKNTIDALQKPGSVFEKCISNAKQNISDFQQYMPDITAEVAKIKEALTHAQENYTQALAEMIQKNKSLTTKLLEKILEKIGECCQNCWTYGEDIHSSLPWVLTGLSVLAISYIPYFLICKICCKPAAAVAPANESSTITGYLKGLGALTVEAIALTIVITAFSHLPELV